MTQQKTLDIFTPLAPRISRAGYVQELHEFSGVGPNTNEYKQRSYPRLQGSCVLCAIHRRNRPSLCFLSSEILNALAEEIHVIMAA